MTWLQYSQSVDFLTTFKELTVRLVAKDKEYKDAESSIKAFVKKWLSNNFNPQNIIIHDRKSCRHRSLLYWHLLEAWAQWNPSAPTGGRIGHIRVYNSLKILLDLFHPLPMLQLQFGRGATLPLMDASKLGERRFFAIYRCYHGNRVTYKKEFKHKIQSDQLSDDITSLTYCM